MASIQCLPFEILASIFEDLHEESIVRLNDTWLALGKGEILTNAMSMLALLSTICSVTPTWKQVAISAPKLWTVIPLLDLHDPPFSVKDFIERSARLPLTLLVDVARDKKIILLAFRLLSHTGAFARISNLSAILSGRGSDSHTCEKTLQLLLSHDMPTLEHLSFCDGVLHLRTEGWLRLENHANQLRTLSLGLVDGIHRRIHTAAVDATPLPLERMELLRLHVAKWQGFQTPFTGPFHALKELYIGSENDRYHAYTVRGLPQQSDRDLFNLLTACPNIERLICHEYMLTTYMLLLTALCTWPLPSTRLRMMIFDGGYIEKAALQALLDARATISTEERQCFILDRVHLFGEMDVQVFIPKGFHIRMIDESGRVRDWELLHP